MPRTLDIDSSVRILRKKESIKIIGRTIYFNSPKFTNDLGNKTWGRIDFLISKEIGFKKVISTDKEFKLL